MVVSNSATWPNPSLVSTDILRNYFEQTTLEILPWEDVQFALGEIVYGGHITDRWDHRVCSAYLRTLLQPTVLEGMELLPGFKCLLSDGLVNHEVYMAHIKQNMPSESPTFFGT